MSTNQILYKSLVNIILEKLISGEPIPRLEAASLFLKLHGHTVKSFALEAGVSSTAVYNDIKGKRSYPTIRKTAQRLFGFVPWE